MRMRGATGVAAFVIAAVIALISAPPTYADPEPVATPTSEQTALPTPTPENDPAVSVQAVGCNNSSCTGKDPQAQGCGADAWNTRTRYDTVGGAITLELRYSPACNAQWTRITVDTYSGIYRRAYIREYDGDYNYLRGYSKDIGNGASGTFSGYTKMIGFNGYRYVRACWRNIYGIGGDPWGPTYCTSYA
ncbi:DUF2690 domain-containing protein [Sphaerisporangium sp. NPDC004334]